jgi:hypothetical protein
MASGAIENALDLMHAIAANYPEVIAKSIPKPKFEKAIKDLGMLVRTEGDEYAEGEVREAGQLALQIQILKEENKNLNEEISALKQVDETRREILTGRIDQLQEELFILRQERASLYDQVAHMHEANEARTKTLDENQRLTEEIETIRAENQRLRMTNLALTQQLFIYGNEESRHLPSSTVLNVLSGKEEVDQERLVVLVAKLQQEMLDERTRFEAQIENLHARIRESESVRSPQSNLANAVKSIGSKVSNIFQSGNDI